MCLRRNSVSLWAYILAYLVASSSAARTSLIVNAGAFVGGCKAVSYSVFNGTVNPIVGIYFYASLGKEGGTTI